MASWTDVLEEMRSLGKPDAVDSVRKKYISNLAQLTGRNVICYYSGWLTRPRLLTTSIIDEDKNALMNAVHKLDRSKGLDLVLHTPGGDIAATESLVHYLRQMFNTDIRVIIPQLAMSAGTMMACAGKVIIMGKQSSLGPIDPHLNNIPAHGVIEEFDRALRETKEDPSKVPMWQVIIGKYHPTFIGACDKAITLANDIVKDWLVTGMFHGESDAHEKASNVLCKLNNHSESKVHTRHFHLKECQDSGLKILPMEDEIDGIHLQDAILSVHHSYMLTFSNTIAIKIVENSEGRTFIKTEPVK